MSYKAIYLIFLVWFLAWGFLLLKFPRQSFRVLAWGKEPKPHNFKVAKIVGYIGLGAGALLFIELIFGLLH
jgi:hypothetical protein